MFKRNNFWSFWRNVWKNLDESSMGVSVRFPGKFSVDILGEIPVVINEEFFAEVIVVILGKKSGNMFWSIPEETRCEIIEEFFWGIFDNLGKSRRKSWMNPWRNS